MTSRDIRTPVERMLDDVKWEPIEGTVGIDDEIPYATHEGILHVGPVSFRVYQLNTGLRVIDERDIAQFFGGLE